MKRESRAFWVWAVLLTLVASVTITCRELADRPKNKDCSGAQGTGAFYTAKWEGTKFTLRLPAVARSGWSASCDSLRHVFLQYAWEDGRLRPVSETSAEALVLVTIKMISDSPVRASGRENWRFSAAMPHVKYPVDLLPRYEWLGPDHPQEKQFNRSWAVRGTHHPIDNLPFVTGCETYLAIGIDYKSLVESELFKEPEKLWSAKCRGGVSALKGKALIDALVDVRIPAVKGIDKIYLSLEKELADYIQEN